MLERTRPVKCHSPRLPHLSLLNIRKRRDGLYAGKDREAGGEGKKAFTVRRSAAAEQKQSATAFAAWSGCTWRSTEHKKKKRWWCSPLSSAFKKYREQLPGRKQRRTNTVSPHQHTIKGEKKTSTSFAADYRRGTNWRCVNTFVTGRRQERTLIEMFSTWATTLGAMCTNKHSTFTSGPAQRTPRDKYVTIGKYCTKLSQASKTLLCNLQISTRNPEHRSNGSIRAQLASLTRRAPDNS